MAAGVVIIHHTGKLSDPPALSQLKPRTTISHDVQTRFPVQLAFAKFLSKIKGNF